MCDRMEGLCKSLISLEQFETCEQFINTHLFLRRQPCPIVEILYLNTRVV